MHFAVTVAVAVLVFVFGISSAFVFVGPLVNEFRRRLERELILTLITIILLLLLLLLLIRSNRVGLVDIQQLVVLQRIQNNIICLVI